MSESSGAKSAPTVWVDFENAPHVHVLAPVISRLRDADIDVVMTARDFSSTVGLCRRYGFEVEVIGRATLATNSISKAALLAERAFGLRRFMRARRLPGLLALSHGSRSQIVAARTLGVPSVSMDDYEHSDQTVTRFVERLLVPFPIPAAAFDGQASRVVHYPGLKEEIYLCGFRPDEAPVEIPGLGDRVAVLFRPEGRFTHYRSAATELVHEALLRAFAEQPGLFVVIIPRDPIQGQQIAERLRRDEVGFWMPDTVVDGPTLLWQMDLVLSGGGTMTREAAVLGVPSYSFFGGEIGAVDRYLRDNGRLTLLRSADDVGRVGFVKRPRTTPEISPAALEFVAAFVQTAARELLP